MIKQRKVGSSSGKGTVGGLRRALTISKDRYASESGQKNQGPPRNRAENYTPVFKDGIV